MTSSLRQLCKISNDVRSAPHRIQGLWFSCQASGYFSAPTSTFIPAGGTGLALYTFTTLADGSNVCHVIDVTVCLESEPLQRSIEVCRFREAIKGAEAEKIDEDAGCKR